MIYLTPTQRVVFDRVVQLTDKGKRTFTGKVCVEGINGSTVRHTVSQCVILGLLKSEPAGKFRRITLLPGYENVQTMSAGAIMTQRMSGRTLKEHKRTEPDMGKFSEAFEAAFGKQGYPSLKMKRDLPFKGTFKPDARAL